MSTKPSKILSSLALVTVVIVTAAFSPAGEPPVRAGGTAPSGDVNFSVLGELPVSTDGTVSVESLDALTAGRASAVMKRRSLEPIDSGELKVDGPVVAVTGTSPVVHSWPDVNKRYTPLRKNVNAKINSKHNVTYKVARATTKYPAPGKAWKVSGTKWNYETKVNQVKCSGWWVFEKCKVARTVWALSSVDFRKLSDKRPYGVVTTYCKGISGKCPDFVKNALNT